MSKHSRELKHAAKARRFDAIVEYNSSRLDDMSGDEHRRMAAHAHVMTHHALEMDTPEAHEAAAAAHRQVAEMHEDAAASYDTPESTDTPKTKKPMKRTQPKGT